MKKETALELKRFADEVGERFSHKDRANNFNGETFTVSYITPLSESTACVIYTKMPTNKRAAFFFYLLGGGNPRWEYFVPTDSHILGMESFKAIKNAIETENFPKNFTETPGC